MEQYKRTLRRNNILGSTHLLPQNKTLPDGPSILPQNKALQPKNKNFSDIKHIRNNETFQKIKNDGK